MGRDQRWKGRAVKLAIQGIAQGVIVERRHVRAFWQGYDRGNPSALTAVARYILHIFPIWGGLSVYRKDTRPQFASAFRTRLSGNFQIGVAVLPSASGKRPALQVQLRRHATPVR